ncbi:MULTISPECIES: hypothetical protein [unclassified Wolbachia]|uniref:hypothetical protein n=1 Tax=unclassified Wolbachia TaxID=2640676 RepID=UPI003132D3D8
MRTPKKIWRGITRKLKNRKDTTTAKEAVIEESRNSNIPEEVEVKEIANADKAAEIDTQLCKNINKNSDNINISQPTCETSEKIQDAPIETSNVPNDFPSNEIKPCDAVEEKSSTKTTQQRQAILAGVVGAVLLVSCVASYLLIEYSKVHVIAVIGGIIGLVCMGFALYNAIKPNTQLEKVEDIQSSLNPAYTQKP